MSNLYGWIADKKREAIAAKLQQRGLPNYQQKPISERYGVSYTGTGADNKVDRTAPAGIAGAPGNQHVYHEGEMRASTPEGDMYVNAEVTNKMMMKPTDQDQMEMNMYAKKGNLPGFLTGGYQPNNGLLVQPGSTMRQGLANTAQTLAGQISNQVTSTAGDPNKRRTSSSAVPVNTQTTPTAPTTRTLPTGATIPYYQFQQPNTNTTQETSPTQTIIQPVRNAAPLNYTSQTQGVLPAQTASATINTTKAPTAEPIKINVQPVETPTAEVQQVAKPAAEPVEIRPPAETGTLAGQQPKEPVSAEDAARGAGLNYLQGTLSGQTGIQLEGQKALDDLRSRQAQERSAAEQQAIQSGMSPDRARVESQILRDKQEVEANDLAAKYGIAGMQEKSATAGTLATQGLAGQQFEQDKKTYGDSADWKAYESAIAAGDFTTAAQAYKRVTGNDISMDQMKTNQTYLNTKQQHDIKTGDLNIKSLETRVGSEQVGAIADAIGKGMSLSQIQAQFPNAKFTNEEFKAMYDATPLGELTFEHNMSFAKTLLEMEDGSGKNTAEATKMFNNAFPGTGIDFSKVVTTQNAATFNQGMSQLSDLVASGMDYTAAIDVMKKNGTLKMMGMDEAGIEKVYRGLKVNAIDEQWKGISESDWYKGLKPEEQTDMSDFFTAVLSGKLDYNVQKEYTVTGKDGTTKTMYFNTEADANSYGTKNGATIVATGKSKVSPVTDVLAGTGSTGSQTNPVEVPSGVSEGGYFNKNGKTYTVDANNNATEVTKTPDNIWGTEASAIIKSGGDMASQLSEARATAITDGTKDWKTIKSVDDPVYKALVESGTGVDGYGDNGKVNPAGAGNDRHSKTNLEDAYNNKTFIKKDGKLYAVTGVSTVKKNWMNWTDYTLTEVGSKDTIKVTAKG